MSYTKHVCVAAACVLSLSSPAASADLGGIAVPAPVPYYGSHDQRPALWQGLYGGVNLGVGSTVLNVDKVGSDRDLKSNAVGFGGFAGYNFANAGPWVWGVEADLLGHGFDKKKPATVAGLGSLSSDHAALGSLRLRGGYAWNDILFYGTAGLALTSIEAKSSLGGKADFKTGLALGLGAEWAFDKAWTARIEGIGYAFGAEETLAGTKRDVGLATSTLRVGVARRF
jgi:outer membrane immunogenic protein